MNLMEVLILASIRDAHQALAWIVVLGNGSAGFWALGAHRVEVARGRPLWWWTAVAQLAIVGQAIVGAILVVVEDLDPPDLHLLYGSVGFVAVGIIYGYRHQVEGIRYLVYGYSGLFLMGLGIRAMII